MLTEYPLNILNEIKYAEKWAYSRNPAYYPFDDIGGDCTNFISQCLYAGGAVMNYASDTGWYYISTKNRAAAWTGVEYLYQFLTNNKGIGPFGKPVPLNEVTTGDIIQLGGNDGFYHSLFVVSIQNGEAHIATHTNDAYNLPLSSYAYKQIRCLRIVGARKDV